MEMIKDIVKCPGVHLSLHEGVIKVSDLMRHGIDNDDQHGVNNAPNDRTSFLASCVRAETTQLY